MAARGTRGAASRQRRLAALRLWNPHSEQCTYRTSIILANYPGAAIRIKENYAQVNGLFRLDLHNSRR